MNHPARMALAAVLAAPLLAAASGPPRPASSPGRVPAAPMTAAPAPPSGSFVIEHVRLFDGVAVRPDQAVLVTAGRIAAVGSEVQVPAGLPRVEGRGRTLLPGLIDAHAHVGNEGQLREAEVFGTTTVLDMFSSWQFVRQAKADLRAGRLTDGADLYSAGTAAIPPGGQGVGGQAGPMLPAPGSPAGAQAWVDARLAEGSDYIKIILDDGSTYGMEWPAFSPEMVRALVAAAHARGRLAVVHIASREEAVEAVGAGADGLMHLFADREPDPGFGRLVAGHHVFVVPTLEVLSSISGRHPGWTLLDDPRVQPHLTQQGKDALAARWPADPAPDFHATTAAIAQLRRAGVPILAGTDAPNPGTWFGASLLGEMKMLTAAGLSPLESLRAATSAPAAAFRLDDRGRIAPGLRADLLLVEGDPSTRIGDVERIVQVWKDGIPCDRDAPLRQELKDLDAAAPGGRGR